MFLEVAILNVRVGLEREFTMLWLHTVRTDVSPWGARPSDQK